MSRCACFSEPFWHTTRVTPGGFVLSAEASERTFGTFPPAAGLTEVSGFGSGQKAVRSTCAVAVAATARTKAATRDVRTAERASMARQCTSGTTLRAPLPVASIRVQRRHGTVRGRRRLGGRAARGSPHARPGEPGVLAAPAPAGDHRGGLRDRGDRAGRGAAAE